MEAEARRQLSEQHSAEPQAGSPPAAAQPGSVQLASSEPAPVGELLDVIV
jgi:hypothetical protein